MVCAKVTMDELNKVAVPQNEDRKVSENTNP